jgi:hypothetical protein
METTIWGVVRNGCIVPSSSLPEGLHVKIQLPEALDDPSQPIPTDSDVGMSFVQMAEAFDQLGSPTVQHEVELSGDPDDFPLF